MIKGNRIFPRIGLSSAPYVGTIDHSRPGVSRIGVYGFASECILPGDAARGGGRRRRLRLLGVPAFGQLLETSGWNRAVADPMRDFGGAPGDLPNLERHLRGTMSAHGTGFLIHCVLSLAAAAAGHPAGALWILLPGVLLHLYPTLLQRWISLRVQPLLRRRGPGGG